MLKALSDRGIVLLLVGFSLFQVACSGVSPRVLRNLEGPGVEFQDKKTFHFNDQKVHFSNRFDGARLNDARVLNDSTFVLSILPENSPINPSPWFAFKVWSSSDTPRPIYLVLDYGDSRHRYWPKLRQESGGWEAAEDLSVNETRSEATFSVQIDQREQLISGQPFFNKDSIMNWFDQLAAHPEVTMEQIGKSTLGESMTGFHTQATASKKAIAIMGGQHPPELTGFEAQMAFVNYLLSDEPLARQFRANYQIVVVPWLNPDGNNLGHWRHNVAGVDLNRDWSEFKQKETTAARDYFLKFQHYNQVQYVFGIDFHSTFRDVLYTNVRQSGHPTHQPGLMDAWVLNWNEKLGELAVNDEPSNPVGRVSKSWMLTALQAEAVTYEVGDTTPYEEIHEKARQAAIALIEVLLGDAAGN